MANIYITRRAGGWVDRARKYKVLVDGEERAEIGAGDSKSIDVPPGSHEVSMKIDWARSETVTVDVADGKDAKLYCEPNANPLSVVYYVSFGRKKYIGLRPA